MGDAVKQQSLDLASYIAQLDPVVKAEVFASSWTAQALFRALSPLAKQYILRLVYIDGGVSKDSLQLWLQPAAHKHHVATMVQLEQLSVLQTDHRGNVQLNADFKRCLVAALSGRGQAGSDPGRQQYQGAPPIKQLSDQAARQWQAVLLYILDSEGELDLPIGTGSNGFSIHDLLLSAGLISMHGGYSHELTPAGLRYLLQPTHQQVWLLLREYIKAAEHASGQELASTLSFLMQLSFRRVWQPHPLDALSDQEQAIAGHMAQLGLLATCKQDGASFFCATPLAASLCGGTAAAGAAAAGEGGGASSGMAGGAASALENSAYIIVETNFRVYAHTSSALQRRVLSLLMRLDCLLPNLFVGTLTREAFMAVLARGLTAHDVIAFLQQHAHPQVARRVCAVPENVQDQLTLWEKETQRVAAEPVTLYTSFEDSGLFHAALNTAHGQGSLLTAHTEGPLNEWWLIIRRSGHEALRDWIKDFKKQREQQQQLLHM